MDCFLSTRLKICVFHLTLTTDFEKTVDSKWDFFSFVYISWIRLSEYLTKRMVNQYYRIKYGQIVRFGQFSAFKKLENRLFRHFKMI